MQIKGTVGYQLTELLKWKTIVASNADETAEREDKPFVADENLR